MCWTQSNVIAGLVPETPIMWHDGALLSGVAGTRPGHDRSMSG
jgi:hypothetical protein